MERKELIELAKVNGVAKAHQTKTVELEVILTEMGVIGNKVEKRGRPINPDSVRQNRIKELEEKRKNGELKKGRPVNPDSVRQMRLKELEEKRENGELRKGRPVNPDSVRQMRLKEIEERKLNGTFKLGRPKMIKSEEEVEENKEANS